MLYPFIQNAKVAMNPEISRDMNSMRNIVKWTRHCLADPTDYPFIIALPSPKAGLLSRKYPHP